MLIFAIILALPGAHLVFLIPLKLVANRTYKKKLQRQSYPLQTRVKFPVPTLHN